MKYRAGLGSTAVDYKSSPSLLSLFCCTHSLEIPCPQVKAERGKEGKLLAEEGKEEGSFSLLAFFMRRSGRDSRKDGIGRRFPGTNQIPGLRRGVSKVRQDWNGHRTCIDVPDRLMLLC
ncbi:hypothetical protein H5410_001696 [Solanum commersonii]|uniref:Uncharacterized protein n=1 Tax=Solanum commersonii TaxID=4109 RepID=A0A9J6B0C1_SOLCO|nr:hypothetical protein H5410_001696 [Solanum commersonii]